MAGRQAESFAAGAAEATRGSARVGGAGNSRGEREQPDVKETHQSRTTPARFAGRLDSPGSKSSTEKVANEISLGVRKDGKRRE